MIRAAKNMTNTKNMTHMTQNRKRKLTRNIQCKYMASCWLGLIPIAMFLFRPPCGFKHPHVKKCNKDDRVDPRTASSRYCFFLPSSTSSVRLIFPVVLVSSRRSMHKMRRHTYRILPRTRSFQDLAPNSESRRTCHLCLRHFCVCV